MPTSHQLDIDTAIDEQGRKVLVAIGDVDLQTAPVLRRRIEAGVEAGEDVVIDLRHVTFMDSPGLGTLIYCDRMHRERGGHLVLRDPSGQVRELFEVVRVADVIELE
jgi:anti-sigma B factor antagonist